MLEPSSAKGKSFAPDECALLYALKNDNWSFLETIFKNKHKGVLFDFMTTASTMGIKKIKKGETVMIVEAMKTMNHIPSTEDGEVKRILVEDGQPVEFGQTLILLK